jgi:hypothetical protein
MSLKLLKTTIDLLFANAVSAKAIPAKPDQHYKSIMVQIKHKGLL